MANSIMLLYSSLKRDEFGVTFMDLDTSFAMLGMVRRDATLMTPPTGVHVPTSKGEGSFRCVLHPTYCPYNGWTRSAKVPCDGCIVGELRDG